MDDPVDDEDFDRAFELEDVEEFARTPTALEGRYYFEFRGTSKTSLLIDVVNRIVLLKQDGKAGVYVLRRGADEALESAVGF